MKDMSIIANKKIINKETNEVRLVVSIDEENRKIHSVPVDEPNAENKISCAFGEYIGRMSHFLPRIKIAVNFAYALYKHHNTYNKSHGCKYRTLIGKAPNRYKY